LANTAGNATLVNVGTITGTGSAKVQQYLAGNNRNYFIGSPVSNATAAVLNNGVHSKFSHNPSEQRYYILANETTLNPTQAYVYRANDAQTLEFVGNLNTGNVSNNSLPRVGTTNSFRGYNLVSNPYPSFINWKDVSKTNLESTIWYRTHNGDNNVFATFNATGDIASPASVNGQAVNEFIAPMQGFWVRVDADGNTGGIAFDNNMRIHRSSEILRAPQQKDIFRFVVNKNGQVDEAVINFTTNASEEFEAYDSRKMYSNITAQLATVAGSEELVINSLPTPDETSVPTKVKFTENGLYTLEATQQSGTLADYYVSLEDKTTKQIVSFKAGEKYSFKGDVNDTERFVVHFSLMPLNTNIVKGNSVTIFANNNQITIQGENLNNAQVRILNISGQLIQSSTISGNQNTLPANFVSGVYVVELNNNGVITREKIVIQ
jgi:hypothetical protein